MKHQIFNHNSCFWNMEGVPAVWCFFLRGLDPSHSVISLLDFYAISPLTFDLGYLYFPIISIAVQDEELILSHTH